MQQLQHHPLQARAAVRAPQTPLVLQQHTLRSANPTHPTRQPSSRGATLVAHIAAERKQIIVSQPQQQQQGPTDSLSYTSFEDDSLQGIIQLQDVCLFKEVARLEQLLQDMTNNCSCTADQVGPLCGVCPAALSGGVSGRCWHILGHILHHAILCKLFN